MKILLVAPPWLDVYGDFREAARLGCASPPLGLMYLGGVIRKIGSDCRVVDMETQNVSPEALLKIIADYSPDIVGLTATTPIFDNACSLARLIRQSHPKLTLGLGGVHSTVIGSEALEQCAELDFQVRGEGEQTIQEIIAALEAGKSFFNIKGVLYRENGQIIENPPRTPIEDINIVPSPARDLVNSHLYKYSVPGKKGFVPYATIFTSRGCPFECIFCSQHTMYGRRMRWFNLDRVMEELKHIVRDLDIHHVIIMDDTLTLSRKRTLALCKAIIGEGLDFTWEGWTRANTIDEDLLRVMKNAGLVRLSLGIESGDPEILKIIKKKVTLEEIRDAYRIAAKVGIETRGSAMLGHPYETRETAWRTLKFIRSIPELKQIFLNVACPYPGTELFDYAANGRGGMRLLTRDYSRYKRYGDPVIEVNDLSARDLKRMQLMGLIYFYFTPGRIYYNVFRRSGVWPGIVNSLAFARGVINRLLRNGK